MAAKERERSRRAEEHYSRYTFEPEINRVSQLLGRSSSTKELVRQRAAGGQPAGQAHTGQTRSEP